MALGGARKRQVARDVEVLSAVTGRVQLGRIGPRPRLPGDDHRAVLPPVPQRQHDRHELIGALVPVRSGRVWLVAEVAGRRRLHRRHDVPPRPPAAEEVKRRQPPCDVPRIAVGGRHGGDQPHLLGGGRNGGQQTDRIEALAGQVLGANSATPGCRGGRSSRSRPARRSGPARCSCRRRAPRRGRPATPSTPTRDSRGCAGRRSGSGTWARAALHESKPSPSRSSVRSHSPRRPSRPVGGGQPVAGQLDHRGAQRLGRERHRPPANEAEPGHLGGAAIQQIQRDARPESAGADAETGVAGAYATRPPSAVPKNTEKRLQVSIAPPQRWVKRSPSAAGRW